MNTPLFTWGCIVGLWLLIVFVRLIRMASFCVREKHRVIELASEREEFYVPGDRLFQPEEEYNEDDFEDL